MLDAYAAAKNLLLENSELLDTFAKELLERETMDGPEIEALIQEAEAKRTVQV